MKFSSFSFCFSLFHFIFLPFLSFSFSFFENTFVFNWRLKMNLLLVYTWNIFFSSPFLILILILLIRYYSTNLRIKTKIEEITYVCYAIFFGYGVLLWERHRIQPNICYWSWWCWCCSAGLTGIDVVCVCIYTTVFLYFPFPSSSSSTSFHLGRCFSFCLEENFPDNSFMAFTRRLRNLYQIINTECTYIGTRTRTSFVHFFRRMHMWMVSALASAWMIQNMKKSFL